MERPDQLEGRLIPLKDETPNLASSRPTAMDKPPLQPNSTTPRVGERSLSLTDVFCYVVVFAGLACIAFFLDSQL